MVYFHCKFLCVDIEKASDHVDWSFLLIVMQKMGFGEKWVGWIKWCISTASLCVLVNGTSTSLFQSSRGLRQRDLISPYLFVIAMEVFNCLLKEGSGWRFFVGLHREGKEWRWGSDIPFVVC